MRVHDHWERTAALWAHGGAVLTWHVLPAGQLDVLAAWLAPFLDRPFLSPVPAEWLHLTTQGVDVARDVERETLDRLVAEAAARCAALEPIAARVGPVRVVDEGVVADVEPVEPLVALRDVLQDADASVRGPDQVPDLREPFRPHVSFAYACADGELDELEAAVAADLVVDEVSLLLLSRAERLYYWEVVATVPLG